MPQQLERQAETESLFTKFQADRGDTTAVFYAMIHAQLGKTKRALDWLETAMRHRDPYLEKLKIMRISIRCGASRVSKRSSRS
jgi:hypothetical protein